MKRDEAIAKLRAGRKELLETLSGVSDEELERANAVGKWSLRDLLGHIAAWDEENVRVLQAFVMQPNPQYSYSISDRSDFAVWNAEQIEQRKNRTLAQIKSEFESARRDLIQVVEGTTDQVLLRAKPTPWNKLRTGLELLQEAAQHDVEHAQDVRSWRKKRERWARARQKYVSKRRESKKKVEGENDTDEAPE